MRILALAAALFLLWPAGNAQASACERLRVSSFRSDTQLHGLYDFCNEYRQLQMQVGQLIQQVQVLERARQTQQLQRAGSGVLLAQVLREPGRAEKRLTLRQPGVLLATAYAVDGARVSLALGRTECAAAAGSATCMRPLDPGEHTVAATRAGGEVVLSVTLLAR